MIAVAVLSILSAAAFVFMAPIGKERLTVLAVERLSGDIAYAQSEAVARHAPRVVVFDETGNRYAVTDTAGTPSRPVSGHALDVRLDAEFPGVTLTLTGLGFAGSDTLTFDETGTPVSGGDVALQSGPYRWVVTVSPGSGRVTSAPSP